MKAQFVLPSPPRCSERGFALLDVMIGVAMMSGMLLALFGSTWHGSQDPHRSALALQLAMSEARGLAMTNGSAAPDAPTSGATVLVAADPNDATRSVITVYTSRPVINPNPTELAADRGVVSLAPEVGRPPVIVPGTFAVLENGTIAQGDFAITIGASGVVNFAPGYRLGGAARPTLADCTGAATISVTVGAQAERHPVGCQDGVFDANAADATAGGVRNGSAP